MHFEIADASRLVSAETARLYCRQLPKKRNLQRLIIIIYSSYKINGAQINLNLTEIIIDFINNHVRHAFIPTKILFKYQSFMHRN
jgi:hypothetical protein